MCLADFATNFVTKYADTDVADDDIRKYTTSVSVESHTTRQCEIIQLKNKKGRMRRRRTPCVMRYHKVSKLKNSEQFFFNLLQLYLPWRQESDLSSCDTSFEEFYCTVEPQISPNMAKHEPFSDIDFDDFPDVIPDIIDSGENAESAFPNLHPHLLYDDSAPHSHTTNPASSSHTSSGLSDDAFYAMCAQLNDAQCRLFNFIMTHTVQLLLNETNDLPQPSPFYIFLSGGAGVGKSFLVKAITQYMKRMLRYHAQRSNQPSVAVTASTGKAATNIDGNTLHSAFKLPRNSWLYTKPGNSALLKMQKMYLFLKVLLVDEASMVGNGTFRNLDQRLRDIMKKSDVPFGGVSQLFIGDLLQLPPVKQKAIYTLLLGTYEALAGNLWRELFQLYELTDIVRQSGDPEFAALLNRVREGSHTDADIATITALQDTDTSSWPEHVKLYITNELCQAENDRGIAALGTDIFIVRAQDSRKDRETGRCSISIPDNASLSDTENLPKILKVAVGARVTLTANVSLPDKLINGSVGSVKFINIPNKETPLLGEIYVQFDDPDAGNSRKNPRLQGDLKNCVKITCEVKTFDYKLASSDVKVERRQYPLIVAYGLTIHKSQGGTLKYLFGDLDRSTNKYTCTGKEYATPVNDGQFYTLLSRGVSLAQTALRNFDPSVIRVNNSALDEMKRMRSDALFSWKHPLEVMHERAFVLWNIRSWHLHLPHFLANHLHSQHCAIMCFTETHCKPTSHTSIEDLLPLWKDVHAYTEHGLAVCYDQTNVSVLQTFEICNDLELLPLLLQLHTEHVLLLLVYRKPGPIGNFIERLTSQVCAIQETIHIEHRTILLGDFNLDQIYRILLNPSNTALLTPLI